MANESKAISGITGEGAQQISTDKDFSVNDMPNGLIRLDIACGNNKKKGFIGIDIAKTEENDIQTNLEETPWPIEAGTVYEANCSHYLEHVKDLKSFMEEVYRILMPNGMIVIRSPYWANTRCWQDYTHVRAITENTMLYFSQKWLKDNKLEHYDVKANFQISNIRYYLSPEWDARAEEAKIWALKHYNNVCDDIEFWLRKLPMEEMK